MQSTTFRQRLPIGAQVFVAVVVLAYLGGAYHFHVHGQTAQDARGRTLCIAGAAFFLAIWGTFALLRANTYVRVDEDGIALKGLLRPEVNVPWAEVWRLDLHMHLNVAAMPSGYHAILYTSTERYDIELLTGQSEALAEEIVISAGLMDRTEAPWGYMFQRP